MSEFDVKESSEDMLKKGYVKVVYNDGFKTNIIFCSSVKVKQHGHTAFLIVKECKSEKKQIFPIGNIVRIQYLGEGKILFE